MEVVASWTKSLCIDMFVGDDKSEPVEDGDKYIRTWSVLDIGTGNGLLLQELAKQGYVFFKIYPSFYFSSSKYLSGTVNFSIKGFGCPVIIFFIINQIDMTGG